MVKVIQIPEAQAELMLWGQVDSFTARCIIDYWKSKNYIIQPEAEKPQRPWCHPTISGYQDCFEAGLHEDYCRDCGCTAYRPAPVKEIARMNSKVVEHSDAILCLQKAFAKLDELAEAVNRINKAVKV